jgi:hypothetical protein
MGESGRPYDKRSALKFNSGAKTGNRFWFQYFQIHHVANQGRQADKPPAKGFAT